MFLTWANLPLHRSPALPVFPFFDLVAPDGSTESRRSLLTAFLSPHSFFTFWGVVSDLSKSPFPFVYRRIIVCAYSVSSVAIETLDTLENNLEIVNSSQSSEF